MHTQSPTLRRISDVEDEVVSLRSNIRELERQCERNENEIRSIVHELEYLLDRVAQLEHTH